MTTADQPSSSHPISWTDDEEPDDATDPRTTDVSADIDPAAIRDDYANDPGSER